MSFELRLRGGDRYRLEIAGDTAAVTRGPTADCVTHCGPVLLSAGRATPTAALTGRIVASGRSPGWASRGSDRGRGFRGIRLA